MVRRTRNGAKLCERPPGPAGCPGYSRTQKRASEVPRPKTPCGNGPNEGCAIALVGGWGEVGLPDSEWAKLCDGLRVPAGCPWYRRAKKRAPQLARPKTAQRKRAKTGGVL